MSFEIARSGINAVSGSLEAISNNIANSGTYGFKSSRANFSSMYSGSQMNGAEVSSLSQSIEKGGGLFNTGRGMDAMIQGRGFFAVKDSAGQQVFTRVGIFNVDKDGFVVDPMGRKVQGYAAMLDANGRPVPGADLGALGDLKLQTGQVAAEASSRLVYNGNMSADWNTIPAAPVFSPSNPATFNSSVTTVVYDSLGAKHPVTQYFVKTATDTVRVHYTYENGAVAKTTDLVFGSNGQLTSVDGVAVLPPVPLPANWKPVFPDVAVPLPAPLNGGTQPVLAINYNSTTRFAGETTTLSNAGNGNAAGMMTGTAIAADGSIVATYSNGQKQTVGTLALATFANENALVAVNDTSWEANAATGSALFARPGSAMASELNVAAIEQSNVDMTGELVNLMSAQRNYQANTKIISAQSEMMQNLMQAV